MDESNFEIARKIHSLLYESFTTNVNHIYLFILINQIEFDHFSKKALTI